MAGTAKTDAGNDKQIKLFGFFTKSHVVLFQRFWEHVESSAGFNDLETEIAQSREQNIFIGFVYGCVRSHICTHGTYSLE